MTTWTKADLRRMQAALDNAGADTNRRLKYEAPDEYRECVNVAFAENAFAIVRAGLQSTITEAETNPRVAAEARAAQRLLDRLETELPRGLLTLPRVVLHSEVAAGLAVAQLAVAVVKPTVVAPYQPDAERDRRQIATNLADVLARGVVEIHRASSDAFGSDTSWSDVDGLTSWRTWAKPAAERKQCVAAWDRCTSDAEKLRVNARPLAVLWADACADEPLPAVLDLRGVPESHGLPIESWRDALADAIRKATRGLVIVVDCKPWALARLLPQRVGGSP